MVEQVFDLPDTLKEGERLIIIGVGGGGGNALDHIIESNVEGVEFIAANTDVKALRNNKAQRKIILGEKLTRGLGAGANPQKGMDAAKESIEQIRESLEGADMIFVTAGMGGGTGTGAAPIIAEVSGETGALVVGVVTTPFGFEGVRRAEVAQQGLEQLRDKVDALLIVENERLLTQADDNIKMVDAYKMANEVLRQAVQGVTDLIVKSGHINLDFADIRTVMQKSGSAIMGVGVADGENAAEAAAKIAIKAPLMSHTIDGATNAIVNVEGSSDMTLREIKKAAELVNTVTDGRVQTILGHVINDEMGDNVRVTVIATGLSDSITRKKTEGGGNMSANSSGRPMRRGLLSSGRGPITLDGSDVASGEEDIFRGMPKTTYDTPAIFRKRQQYN
ncbi:cell division protein FtsZ [Synergistales bacterium]|nr:cell division protein FtsZ [Synergistales bacterium]